MTQYLIEDTHNGFRISLIGRSVPVGCIRHRFDEPGGHGIVEGLFASADGAWNYLRTRPLGAGPWMAVPVPTDGPGTAATPQGSATRRLPDCSCDPR